MCALSAREKIFKAKEKTKQKILLPILICIYQNNQWYPLHIDHLFSQVNIIFCWWREMCARNARFASHLLRICFASEKWLVIVSNPTVAVSPQLFLSALLCVASACPTRFLILGSSLGARTILILIVTRYGADQRRPKARSHSYS